MKEKIIVKNFSVIKDIELEINNINIIIGEQATGKSVLAKLIYFFREQVIENYKTSLLNNQPFSNFKILMENNFKMFFPAYFWERESFEIIFYYKIDNTKIVIKKDTNSNAPKIKIEFSDRITRKYKEIKNVFINQKQDPFNLDKITKLENKFNEEIYKTFNSEFLIFTPASRAFFTLYKENIFSLNLLKISDFFITKFGSYYEKLKRFNFEPSKLFNKLSKEILKGELYFDKKDDWIYSNNGNKIKLKDSSTGQQELAPIILLLKYIESNNTNNFLIIEEPEAHIFPSTQKKLVEFFTAIYNYSEKRTGYFLTTHSPYILTCFNNLIQAQNTYEVIKNKKVNDEITEGEFNKLKEKLDNTISPEKRINFNDISVFLMKGGKLFDTKDYKNKLLNSDAIDKVSEDISDEFTNLLEIEFYGEQE